MGAWKTTRSSQRLLKPLFEALMANKNLSEQSGEDFELDQSVQSRELEDSQRSLESCKT